MKKVSNYDEKQNKLLRIVIKPGNQNYLFVFMYFIYLVPGITVVQCKICIFIYNLTFKI